MMRAVHFAIFGVAFGLAGCAGGASLTSTVPSPEAKNEINGRWVLSAPNAPFCGLNFSAPARNSQDGRVSPEGGCPAKFFLSRRYRLDGDKLIVTDENNDVLGTFTASPDGYEGTAATGERISLNR
jgi:hypothetical protein